MSAFGRKRTTVEDRFRPKADVVDLHRRASISSPAGESRRWCIGKRRDDWAHAALLGTLPDQVLKHMANANQVDDAFVNQMQLALSEQPRLAAALPVVQL